MQLIRGVVIEKNTLAELLENTQPGDRITLSSSFFELDNQYRINASGHLMFRRDDQLLNPDGSVRYAGKFKNWGLAPDGSPIIEVDTPQNTTQLLTLRLNEEPSCLFEAEKICDWLITKKGILVVETPEGLFNQRHEPLWNEPIKNWEEVELGIMAWTPKGILALIIL